jgi:hypothetical protein
MEKCRALELQESQCHTGSYDFHEDVGPIKSLEPISIMWREPATAHRWEPESPINPTDKQPPNLMLMMELFERFPWAFSLASIPVAAHHSEGLPQQPDIEQHESNPIGKNSHA